MKPLSMTVITITSFILVGCMTNTNTVSNSNNDIKDLESRVSVLESQVEILNEQISNNKSNKKSKNDPKELRSIVVDSGVPSNTEYDEFVVNLNMDNIEDYISLNYVAADYITNAEKGSLYSILLTSNVFDYGWVYKDCSEFQMTIQPPSGEELQSLTAFEETSRLFNNDEISKQPSIVDVRGKIRFESINVVQKYEVDDFKYIRSVVFYDGKKSDDHLNSGTYTYKY